MRQQLTAIAVMTLVAGLAACSGDDEAAPPSAASTPSAIAELAEDPTAATAISEAIRALREGNSGTFASHLEYADLTFDYHGSYRLKPRQQRVSVTADLADGPTATEAVGDDGRFFVRLPPDGPVSSKCWVMGDPRQITEVTGVETNPDFNQLPGAVSLASTAVGIAPATGRDDVLGSVDLSIAMAQISPRLPALLGIAGAQHRVLARFSLTEEGAMSGIEVDGPAILAALADAGTEVDQEELASVFGAATPITVTLADSGADVVIEPPAASAVIDLDSSDAPQRVALCD